MDFSVSTPRTAFVLSILFWLAACQSVVFDYGFDPDVDFAVKKTFAWTGPRPLLVAMATPVNPVLESHLMQATRDELERRGIRFVNDSSSADLLVSFAVGRQQTMIEAQPKTFLNSDETDRFDPRSYDFSESQLSINLTNRATGRLAWYGSSSKGLSGSDQAKIEQVVNRLVGAILKKFPPDT